MWYVIRTEPGQEEAVWRQVRNRIPGEHWDNCKVLYRACKKRYLGAWHEERELFLPGYLFWVEEESADWWKNFCKASDSREAFRYDGSFFFGAMSPVGKDEEEFLKKITEGKDEISMSYGVIRNGVLNIFRGAMAGMEDRVTKIDRHKRKGYIKVWLDEEERVAEIGLEITEKTYSMGNVSGVGKN